MGHAGSAYLIDFHGVTHISRCQTVFFCFSALCCFLTLCCFVSSFSPKRETNEWFSFDFDPTLGTSLHILDFPVDLLFTSPYSIGTEHSERLAECHALSFVAPELMLQVKPDKVPYRNLFAADIWSFGVVVLHALLGHAEFLRNWDSFFQYEKEALIASDEVR